MGDRVKFLKDLRSLRVGLLTTTQDVKRFVAEYGDADKRLADILNQFNGHALSLRKYLSNRFEQEPKE